MRWTQVRRVFIVVGLITILYGLVIIGRMSAGASVSLWGINPTVTAPPLPLPVVLPTALPVPVPPALAPAPLITAQIIPAPAPPAPSAPAPDSPEELERAYKAKLLAEGENP